MGTDGHKPYYQLTADEALAELRTTAAGLPKSEAADRRHHLGENRLILPSQPAAWQLLLARLKNPLVLLLLGAGGAAAYVHAGETAAFLVLAALVNASIGFVQEYKAVQLPATLAKLVPKQAKVLHKHHVQTIDSRELVPGDIICLEAGDRVPADARIVEESELATNDFELTGASQPTRKFTHALAAEVPPGSQNNLVYLGTTVVMGSCRAVVTGTSMNTELGRLVSASPTGPAGTSPLQREIKKLTGWAVKGAALLAVAAAIIGLQANLGTKTALLFAISLAAIVPAGLQIEAGLILTQAAGWLARAGGSAKKLSAIDTLGGTSVLLTDKTALTTGELTVHELLIGKTHYRVSGTGYAMNGIIGDAKGTPLTGAALKDLHLFFQAGALANNARVLPPDQDHAAWHVSGNAAEGALITLARKAGVDTDGLHERFPERQEYPFDAVRQRTSSVRAIDGQLYVFVQGTPEAVLAASTEIWDHGHIRKLASRDRQFLLGYRHEQIAQGKRGRACAYRILSPHFDISKHPVEAIEQELIFLGMISMDDPVVETTPDALAELRHARVNLSLITSELPLAAAATARTAGPDSDTPLPVVPGEELSRLADNQIVGLLVGGGAVFNCIGPADRLRLVELARQSRQVVAATGQSLREAPLLQRADTNLSLATGDVTELSAITDIALPAGGLATVVSTIERGRLAWQHIKTAAGAALTDSVAELLLILGSLAATLIWGIPAALTALQILTINIIIQLLPLGALGGDPATGKLMHAPPRNRHERLVSRNALHRAFGTGLVAAGLAFANYLLFFTRHHLSPVMSPDAAPYLQATTLTCVTLALCQFINLLVARHPDDKPFFSRALWNNNKLLMAFALSLLCLGVIVYHPSAQAFFGTSPLTFGDWSTAAAAALLYTFVCTFHRHTRRYGHRQLFATHHPAKIRAHLRNLHKTPKSPTRS